MLFALSRSAKGSRHERTASSRGPKESSLQNDVLDGVPLCPASVGEAYECLTTVGARLRAKGDPRAAFTDVYAVITRRVRDAIEGSAECPFVEPEFISRLAGRFCALYLAALRRSLNGDDEPISAWAAAAERKGSARTLPVQHALLGLNAHINYDLAIGLYDNVAFLGAAGDDARMARYQHDHDAVNAILEEAMPEVLSLLAERYGCPIADLVLRSGGLGRALCGGTIFTLRVWRSRVWRDLSAMLAAQGPRGRARIASRMDLRSGLFATVLGLPLPPFAISAGAPLVSAALSFAAPRAPAAA